MNPDDLRVGMRVCTINHPERHGSIIDNGSGIDPRFDGKIGIQWDHKSYPEYRSRIACEVLLRQIDPVDTLLDTVTP